MARQTIAELNLKIEELNNLVTESISKIEELNNEVSEKGAKIEELNTRVTENNTKIEELNNEVSEKGIKIEELNTTVTESNTKIEELNNEVSERDTKIEELNTTVTESNTKIEELNTTVTENNTKIEDLNNSISEKDTKINELNVKISERDAELKKTKSLLKQFEVRKFAVAFEDEKKEYKEEVSKWKPIAIYSFIILLITTFIITIISFYIGDLDKLSLLLIESVAVLFAIFSVKQYLYYTSHYSDSLRRQTLAQGYQHILEGDEDNEIKPEYKDKLVNVLCDNEKKDNKYKFPQEEILDRVLNLTEGVTKFLGKQ